MEVGPAHEGEDISYLRRVASGVLGLGGPCWPSAGTEEEDNQKKNVGGIIPDGDAGLDAADKRRPHSTAVCSVTFRVSTSRQAAFRHTIRE